ncbi:MAG TPA: XdhC family protein [Noviherbaspirillum sp.]|jgi:xanthine dehydrogenase accessory factor|uniref:XdhC family protein n=1 Tax=Noviherbaspirillum sp. TaxID=1926288 RepID=UPI002DDC97F3|nr:XdhC family protein [Noviherbaspirillum sp.]HEV2609073.1 XdhC family protein [Noviherbaspirillum sp.]
MDSVDLEVLKACSRWLNEGRGCELVTVIRTWGSSPRPEGAMLAIRDDGLVVGSVSGGCIEDDLIDRVRRDGITRTHPELVTYGISADEAHRFGLPCGGTLQLAIEPVSARSAIDALLERLARHQLVARRVDLATGDTRLDPAAPGMTMQVSDSTLTTIHGPRWRLLIIGAGQLSRFLAQIAVGMDYQVTVCDPREEYRDAWPVPEVTMLHAMPDDAVLALKLDSRSAVVALTHDPKLDDLALMEALKSEAFYVGAIGSRANNAKRRERLKEFDLGDAELAKLRGPVGLYIGSKTPAEIAISILAELTAAKNGVTLPDTVRVAAAKEARYPAAPDSGCTVR